MNNHTYGELAKYYDIVYANKDYRKEAEEVSDLIKKYKKTDQNLLLDVACGTGMHLTYFQKNFSCTGIDLSQHMLKIARSRLKNVKLHRADMLNFNLGETFDVVTCLFGSIGYSKTLLDLKKVVNGCYRHLKLGGVLVMDSWYRKEQWKPGAIKIGVYSTKDVKLIRASYNSIDGRIAIFNEHYLLAEKDKGIRHFFDSYKFGLFERIEIVKILKACHFNRIVIKRIYGNHDRYIAVK
jgi:ubiquinone/menaquinone biosynthesis C-methylase UbiE